MDEKIKQKLLMLILILYLLAAVIYFSSNLIQDKNDNILLRDYGTITKCEIISYTQGDIGVRGPKKGYYNRCQYKIGNSIHHCYIFTSKKPFPINTKITLKYFQKKNGKIIIQFPTDSKYDEYGFNDYGY